MKTTLIFADDGTVNINFTPENDNETRALSYLNEKNAVEVAIQDNTNFMDERSKRPFTHSVSECKGGYLRAFNDQKSKTLVLRPIQKERAEIDLSEPHTDFHNTFQPVDHNTLQPLEISRNADECLKMLKYWDEFRMTDTDGSIVHQKIKDANTMKVVKAFLKSLIDNFPGQ